MNGYHTVRCLFCTVGKEKIVVDTVHKNDWGHAIFPKRVGFVRTKGQWIEVSKPLLPGYVFVYSDEEQPRYDELASVNHVVRVLGWLDAIWSLLIGSGVTMAALAR